VDLLACHGPLWQQPSTAPDLTDPAQFFEVTHPFHPLFGKVFALVDRRRTLGEDRAFHDDDAGTVDTRCGRSVRAANCPPRFGQSSRSVSKIRVSNRAQLMRAGRTSRWSR
jgi:hypothetical protein